MSGRWRVFASNKNKSKCQRSVWILFDCSWFPLYITWLYHCIIDGVSFNSGAVQLNVCQRVTGRPTGSSCGLDIIGWPAQCYLQLCYSHPSRCPLSFVVSPLGLFDLTLLDWVLSHHWHSSHSKLSEWEQHYSHKGCKPFSRVTLRVKRGAYHIGHVRV